MSLKTFGSLRRALLYSLIVTLTVTCSSEMFAAEVPSQEPTNTVVTVGVPTGFSSHTANLNHVKIHYVIGGSGPPILLIHGWPETWYSWRKVMPLLARRFTVIAADLRGFGDSSLEPSGYDKKTLAQDMHELMTSLGFRTVTLVGHDWGAPVAYAYAAQYKDAVDKLIMVEGAPFGPWMSNTNPIWFFNLLRIPNYAEALIHGRERAFLSYFYKNEDFHGVPDALDAQTIDAYNRAYAREGRMLPTYGLYRTIDQDVKDNGAFAKQPLGIPVLAVGAEKGNGPWVAKEASEVASHVMPILFHETGHFIPEERPAALVDVILKFLDGQSVPADWRPGS